MINRISLDPPPHGSVAVGGAMTASRAGASWLVALVSAVIAVGNLVLTAGAQAILPVDYLLICLTFCVILGLYRLKLVVIRIPTLGPLIIFLISCTVGLLSSPGSPYAVNKYLTFAILLLLAAAVATLVDPITLHRPLVLCLVTAGVVSSCLLLVFGNTTLSGRSTLLDLNPIGLARATGLGLVVAVSFLIARSRPDRRLPLTLVLMAAGILSLIATVSTGSRGPLLSAVIALACVAALNFWTKRLGVVSLLLLGAFAFVAYSAVRSVGGAGLERLESGVDSGRGDLYAQSWEIIQAQPFLGIGWGNFPFYTFDYAPADGVLYPHNVLLEIWMEGGILALAGFGLLCAFAVIRASRVARDRPWSMALFGLLVYALINALFSSDVVGNRLMWVLIVVAILSSSRAPKPKVAQNRRLAPLALGKPRSFRDDAVWP